MTLGATTETSSAGGLLRAVACCLCLWSVGPSGSLAAAAQTTDRGSLVDAGASADVQRLAAWVIASGDNHGLSSVIVDKVRAEVFVLHSDGRLRGAAPALLGAARGDESAPGIGDRKLSAIRPEERTTPAGRFVAHLGANLGGKDVVWVDYANAVSLHRVVTANPKEQRLERLATPTARDNRISYGCINVPARFFDEVVRPAFTGGGGVVYVLPETRSITDVFQALGLHERERGPVAEARAR